MSYRKIIYLFLAIGWAASLILGGRILSKKDSRIRVVFLDVGQGDAILISQKENQILIDGGADPQRELEKIGRYIPFWDRKIETVISTHPDQDHFGGLLGVLENYKIGQIIDAPVESDSAVFKRYRELIEKNNLPHFFGEAGTKIILDGAELEIIYPGSGDQFDSLETNDASLVARLACPEKSFLFTGDLPTSKDLKLFSLGFELHSEILKISHHGSKYSTSAEFLERVSPQEAVISVGRNNRYGHPAPEVLERIEKKKIKIIRTDEVGDIVYFCDSKEK